MSSAIRPTTTAPSLHTSASRYRWGPCTPFWGYASPGSPTIGEGCLHTAISRLDRRALGVIVLVVLTLTAVSAAGTDDFGITTVTPQPDQTLTEPIRWKTTVSGLAAERVEFFVDDELRWTENYEPYYFNGDDGWLTPSTLSPGPPRPQGRRLPRRPAGELRVVVNIPGAATSTPPSTSPPPSDGGAGTTTGTGSPSGSTTSPAGAGSTPGTGTGATRAARAPRAARPPPRPRPRPRPRRGPDPDHDGGHREPRRRQGRNLVLGRELLPRGPLCGRRRPVDPLELGFADGQWWQVDLGDHVT